MTLYRSKIIVDSVLGTEDFEAANISAYPIPTLDKVRISLGAIKGQNVNASIYGILGNKVLEKNSLINNETIDLSHLRSGTYVLKLFTSDKVYTSKIVKE